VPLAAGEGSPAANDGRTWQTNDVGVRFGSPRVDRWWCLGWRWLWQGCGSVPTVAWVPTKLEAGKINARPWELLWGLGKRLEALADGGSERRCELTEAAMAMAGGSRQAHAREERDAAFYSQARRGIFASRLSVRRVNARGTTTLGVRVRRAPQRCRGRARTRRVALGSPAEAASWSGARSER
jgi:hypothetical protein